MIRKDNEREITIKEALFNAPGKAIQKHIVNKEEMYNHARLCANMTLKKNCGVGYHEHHGEKEIYVILKGKAVYTEDDQTYEMNVGDVSICESGHGHAILNKEDEDLEVLAIIFLE